MTCIFTSEPIGTRVYVFSDDHCPPHVHARHRGDGWVARVKFSYLSTVVELISIVPLKNIPLQRVINQLLDDVAAHLAICRRSWWQMRHTTCIANQWVRVLKSGKIAMSTANAVKAKQIATAAYDPDSARLTVMFRDGTTAKLEA